MPGSVHRAKIKIVTPIQYIILELEVILIMIPHDAGTTRTILCVYHTTTTTTNTTTTNTNSTTSTSTSNSN